MSSMVGGVDVVLQTAREGFDPRTFLDAVLDFWPDARFQDAEADEASPLAAILNGKGTPESREFFVYKDAVSAASWQREGWTAGHGNDMVHFLIATPAGSDVVQLTLVIGSLTST